MQPFLVDVVRRLLPRVVEAVVVEELELRGKKVCLRGSAVVTRVYEPTSAANDPPAPTWDPSVY